MYFKEWFIKLEQSGAIKLHRKADSPEYQARIEAQYGRYGAYPTYMKKKQKKMQEMIVYHGSPSPIDNWDKNKQVSGYYPGLYAWPEEASAKNHGLYVYPLEIDEEKFYKMQDSGDLKQQANKAGYSTSSGSGYQDVEYLKSLGYEGIIRGKEYIIFNPSSWTEAVENTIDLPFSTATEQGITFKTGVPVTFKYMRAKHKASNFGSTYQQNIEVAGRYLIHNAEPGDQQDHWEIGEITFRHPLVMKFNLNKFGGYDADSWKAILNKHYGLTGKRLSKAIRKDGYDGIVTTENGIETKEIVDISMF